MIYASSWPAVVFDLGGARPVSAAMSLPYGSVTIGALFFASYGMLPVSDASLTTPYGIAARYRASAQLLTPWAYRLQATLLSPWANAAQVASASSLPWSALAVSQATLLSPWVNRSAVASEIAAAWASDERDIASAALFAPWSESTPAWRSVDTEPRLVLDGESLPILSARLSADEDSPYWMANITLARRADYDRLPAGSAVSLILAGETYALVVDGRTLSRPDAVSEVPAITARSPLCLLDAPFCEPISSLTATQPIMASTQVSALLWPVDWQLIDWMIPAGRIAFANATPLSIARAIVGAVGGLIESRPDGSIVCRPRHAVRPCTDQYDREIVESDLFALSENVTNSNVFDAVVVGDGQDAAGASDEIEFVANEDDPQQGVVRAYPKPWRDVDLVHTSQNVSISTLGEIEFTTDEVIEFIGGTAQCKYPADRVISASWRYADLGAIRASGKTITATEPGYSLLAITYATRAKAWAVSHPAIEDVQFLLMEQ